MNESTESAIIEAEATEAAPARGRKPLAETPLAVVEVNEGAFDALQQSANALATLEEQQAQSAVRLAAQLGYEGPISAGALEDGIRFYQRRTVEALLECGKRLLLMREVTPHGEFKQRVEMLGFSYRTAARFMQAAEKITKSATVALLATQVKNQKAFLELVTHDDDADIERVAELDDIDRMSASELRAALRKEKQGHQRTQQVADELNSEVVQLKAASKVVADTDWPDALAPIGEQVAAAGRKLATALSELETCRITLFEQASALADDKRPAFEAALRHVAEVYAQALERAERSVGHERLIFDKTLGAFAE